MSFDWNAFAAECPVAIVAVQRDGAVVFANRAAATLLGYGLGELDGLNAARVLPTRAHPPAGEDWVTHLATRTIAAPAPCVLVHRGGAELESHCLALPGHDVAGRDLCVMVLSMRSEHLGEVEDDVAEVHRAIFDNAPLGIFYFDQRGVLTALNDRFIELIGSSRRHLVGLNTLTLKNVGVVDAIRRALSGERARWAGDYTSITGGRRAAVRLVVEPIRDRSGAVIAGLGLVEDVTEQARAQELVERTERLASLGTFAAGLALDVEAPLALTLANIELAMRLVEDQGGAVRSELAVALANARDGAGRVAETVRDLKTIAREDLARRAPVALDELVARVLASLAGPPLAKIRVDVSTRPAPAVLAVAPRLEQAFSALLSRAAESARQASDGEAKVTVRVGSASDGRARVEVEDTGPALTAEEAQRLFEPFSSDAPGRQGLGLAVAHGVVLSLGGEIYLDRSRPEGQPGACFVVLLPPAPDAAAAALPLVDGDGGARGLPPGSIPPPVGRARGKVLVVDDEERLAATLRLALSGEHDVDVATRGRRALELLREREYDVILCDLSLPDVSGIDVFEEAKKMKPELGARFVFLTGGAFQARTRAFLQSVDNARLDKPFDLDALERLIAERVSEVEHKPA